MRPAVIYARSAEYAGAIRNADALIASPAFSKRKDEARTLAGIVDAPRCGPVFIKRAASRSWLAGLLERLTGSRAERAVSGARILEGAKLPHPRIFAALELRHFGAVRASYLMSEALEDADTLSRFALGPGEIKGRDVRRRKRISDAVAAVVRRCHDAGIYTRDLQETNIMVADDGANGFKVCFIDLEDFRSSGKVPERQRFINLVHLDRSIGRFMCRASRLDFLYSYLGSRPERREARRIVNEILALRAEIENRRHRRPRILTGRLRVKR
jgi:tRNA A-37 threonylcarbamoyl transferase component Bud32